MKPKVLITRRIYPEAIEILNGHADIDYNNSDDGLAAEELLQRSKDKTAIAGPNGQRFGAELLDQLAGLKIIANIGVGFDNVDIAAATKKGILVSNTPDILTDTTADFAFALLMAAALRVAEADRYVREGKWLRGGVDLLAGLDIHHRTLGIFGLGRIGAAMARRGKGFAMRILYNDAQRASEALERELGARLVSKEELLRDADFISIHTPLNEGTRKLIGEPELRLMKKSAILVNTARGPVMDEAAVARALSEGWIAGAGLDVFEREPTVNADLLKLNNVVLAPHIASSSIDTRREMCVMAARNVLAALEGKRPPNLVNPAAWDSR